MSKPPPELTQQPPEAGEGSFDTIVTGTQLTSQEASTEGPVGVPRPCLIPQSSPEPELLHRVVCSTLVLTNPKLDLLSDPATPKRVSRAFSATHTTIAAILDHCADTTPGNLNSSLVAQNTACNTLDGTLIATHSDPVVFSLLSSLVDCEVALLTETEDCYSPTGHTVTSGPLAISETQTCLIPATLPQNSTLSPL